MEEIIKAYPGNEPYIFISYAHKDSDKVLPIIKQLMQDGYRVWYDEGIAPGSAWDEEIANHLHGCSFFLAFISKSYIVSTNCRDELSYCRKNGKNSLMVYLEDVELTPGMKMRYNRLQAIFKNSMSEAAFYDKLYTTTNLDLTKD